MASPFIQFVRRSLVFGKVKNQRASCGLVIWVLEHNITVDYVKTATLHNHYYVSKHIWANRLPFFSNSDNLLASDFQYSFEYLLNIHSV